MGRPLRPTSTDGVFDILGKQWFLTPFPRLQPLAALFGVAVARTRTDDADTRHGEVFQ